MHWLAGHFEMVKAVFVENDDKSYFFLLSLEDRNGVEGRMYKKDFAFHI